MVKKKTGEKPKSAGPVPIKKQRERVKCGLCGKSERLTKTECCNQWICDDEDEYILFSYARNSCHRNHSRYTLCSYHYNEGHEGDWRECEECEEGFETEMYVWYGTNEYNFLKLKEVPKYKPTRCVQCKRIIKLAEDGYVMAGGKYSCIRCKGLDLSRL